jgi:predicted DNA-binding transcriptional regulator YafY
MSQFDRIVRLKRWLDNGRCVKREHLLRELEVSPATLKRDIAKLRHELNAPIDWDSEQQGWRLNREQAANAEPVVELPGLNFTPDEAHALLSLQHLLTQLDLGGLLAQHIQPVRHHLDALVQRGAHPKADLGKYLRIAGVGTRRVHLPCFQNIGTALLNRKRLLIVHTSRARHNEQTQREISPQRLIHYRSNWYLDAWCHSRNALRSFAVDAIEAATVMKQVATEMDAQTLHDALAAGYGIFAGAAVQWAKLRFSPERSRWVAAEVWHAQQRGVWDDEKRWTMEIPYADPRELVMDILRHVPHVEVLAPLALRQDVLDRLRLGVTKMLAGSAGEPGV